MGPTKCPWRRLESHNYCEAHNLDCSNNVKVKGDPEAKNNTRANSQTVNTTTSKKHKISQIPV